MPKKPDPVAKSKAQKKWADKHRDELAQYQKERRKAGKEPKRGPDPDAAAHKVITSARRRGDLRPPSRCQSCGAARPGLAAHHEGTPLNVKWMCPSCHRKQHKGVQGGIDR